MTVPKCPTCGRNMRLSLEGDCWVCVADRDDHVLGILVNPPPEDVLRAQECEVGAG